MKNLIIIALFFAAFTSFGQQPGSIDYTEFPLAAENEDLLIEVFQALASHSHIDTLFKQEKYISSLNRTFTAEGRMVFSSELGILWEMTKPFTSLTIIGRDAYVQQAPGGKISRIEGSDNQTFSQFSRTIQSVFLGNYEEVKDLFTIYIKTTDKGAWTIALAPKDEILSGVIAFFVLSGQSDIDSLSLIEPSGDSINYLFNSISYPEKLSDDDRIKFNL